MPGDFHSALVAPAKINLHLRIRGRRADGFHELETRLASLALGDRLTLHSMSTETLGELRLTCSDPSVPVDESNLVLKAVRALERRVGALPSMAFHLEKHIPHGAGLGGGSSDAAAALRLVQAFAEPSIPDEVLHAAAAETGSDVPFFLTGGVADAGGRGEIIQPVRGFSGSPRILLIKLPFGIPTPWAYREWLDSKEIPGFPYAPQPTPWGTLVNDLERPVFAKYRILGHLKARLLSCAGVAGALMSGSGSTIFAILDADAETGPVIEAVHGETGKEVWICDTRLQPQNPRLPTRTGVA